MDYTVHGILQARIQEWVSHSLLPGIFPVQGLNPGFLQCMKTNVQGVAVAWVQEGQEELLHVQGAVAARVQRAERSYSKFKVRRGSHEEIHLIQGKKQWLHFAG